MTPGLSTRQRLHDALLAWCPSYLFVAFVLRLVPGAFGPSYFAGTGFWGPGFAILTVPVAVIGLRSESRRVHVTIAVLFLFLQVAVGFELFPALGG